MMNNDISREERLKRIQDGLPPLDQRAGIMSSSNRAVSIRGGASPSSHHALSGQKREISDAAANLIAQALKTLLHS